MCHFGKTKQLYYNCIFNWPMNTTKNNITYYFDLHLFVGKSKGTLFVVNNLQSDLTPRYTHISSLNKVKSWEGMNNHLNFQNIHSTY